MILMQKAFIFDMDGVLVDSENAWKQYGDGFLDDLLGKEIAQKIGDTIGMTVNTIYDKAVGYGFSMDKEKYFALYDEQASRMYVKAKITQGLDALVKTLLDHNFKLALVSSSRRTWIDYVLPRLSFSDKFDYILSLNDRPDLKPKPNPDGYMEAMGKLGASSKTTIILEDSNSGIQAAKASGAFTIGFKKNLVPLYVQRGADEYADSVNDIIRLISPFLYS